MQNIRMKLDPDLLRNILLEIETLPAEATPANARKFLKLTFDSKSEAEVSEHVKLLQEAGYIEAIKIPQQIGILWFPTRITWKGHEYLASVRAENVYAKTKEIASKAFGALTIETIKAAVPAALNALLKSHGYILGNDRKTGKPRELSR